MLRRRIAFALLFAIILCSMHVCYKLYITIKQESIITNVNEVEIFNKTEPWYTVYHQDMSQLRSDIPKDLKLFRMAMNETEFNIFMKLLEVFSKTMEMYNITYSIDGGSLLGIYRHHGPIPWDDDFDVIVNIDQKNMVNKALDTLKADYVLTKWHGKEGRWKLYSKEDSKQTYEKKNWRWPFLDIFWFKENGTYIHDVLKGNDLSREHFYPLRKRPFGHLNIYAPCNVAAKLKVNKIDWNFCVSNRYNHRKEVYIKGPLAKVPCEKLYQYYPFVKRYKNKDGTLEHLVAQNKTMSSYKEPTCN